VSTKSTIGYLIKPEDVNRLEIVKKRLYAADGLSEADMRNLAQLVEQVLICAYSHPIDDD
jgi:hypothetical protein